VFRLFKRKKKIIWRCERSVWAFWHEDWLFERIDDQFTLGMHNRGAISGPLHTLKLSVYASAVWSTAHVSVEADSDETPKTFILKVVSHEAAITMVEALASTQRVTVGADKNYHTKGFVEAMCCTNATQHVAQNDTKRSSTIDGRTARHAGYLTSQRIGKRIEECFGWLEDHWRVVQKPVCGM